MSLQTQLTSAFQAVGADVKDIVAARGSLAALTTTDKTSIVNAINELVTTIGGLAGGGAVILDTAGDGDTAHTWSADKIYDSLQALKTEILGGASSAWDTLQEIQAWAEANDSTVSGLITSIANRVRFDAAQSLTTAQQLQACTNIGVGDPETDYAAVYATAKA